MFANTVLDDGWRLMVRTRWIILGLVLIGLVPYFVSLLIPVDDNPIRLVLEIFVPILSLIVMVYLIFVQLNGVLKKDPRHVKSNGEFGGFFGNMVLIGLMAIPAYALMIAGGYAIGLSTLIVGTELRLYYLLITSILIYPPLLVVSTSLAARILDIQKGILPAFGRFKGQYVYVFSRSVPISLVVSMLYNALPLIFEFSFPDGPAWAAIVQALFGIVIGYYLTSVMAVIIGRAFVREELSEGREGGTLTMPYVGTV